MGTTSCRPKRVSFVLGLALPIAKAAQVFAQDENNIGYRHELYQEDKDRIHVDTDSVHLDIGLSSNVRLAGDFVIDSISGATPTGAPPQAQWPFPSYNNLYQTAYSQAYTVLFNQFVRDNQVYVDSGYETYQQMTNQAAQAAQTGAPGVATTSANASYYALTNSPNFRSTTVPLALLHDHRDAFSLRLPLTLGQHLLTPSFSYSEEHDYISFGGALNYSLLLNEKNTTLNVGWAHNQDSVRDDRFIWEDKRTDDFMVGLIQLLTRRSYLTATFTFSDEEGYLSDPYRGVMPAANFPQNSPNDAALIPERRPRRRDSEIADVTYTQFITPLHGSLEAEYRFFHDSWDINAHTFSLAWHQKIGRPVVISPTFRYYLQSAADFYYVMVPDYLNLPPAYSADYRLSHMQTFAFGLSAYVRVHRNVSLEGSYMRYYMEGLDGVTSQSAYPAANVFTAGLRIWF